MARRRDASFITPSSMSRSSSVVCAIVHQHTQEAAQALHGDVAAAAAAVAPPGGRTSRPSHWRSR